MRAPSTSPAFAHQHQRCAERGKQLCTLNLLPATLCTNPSRPNNPSGDNPAIIVGNAQPALLEWAAAQQQGSGRVVLCDKPLAHGILEGMARHGLY